MPEATCRNALSRELEEPQRFPIFIVRLGFRSRSFWIARAENDGSAGRNWHLARRQIPAHHIQRESGQESLCPRNLLTGSDTTVILATGRD